MLSAVGRRALLGFAVVLLLSAPKLRAQEASPEDQKTSLGASTPSTQEPDDPDKNQKGEKDKAALTVYDEIKVTGRGDEMLGIADSATEGVTGQTQLAERPILRPAEVLETVPGLIISQHSGSGKANQYYLRGFNLDHGTDFRITVDGIPVNLPSHGHGQGYSDLNFLIPELIDSVRYKKGPYYADEGDFSAAGATHIQYLDKVDHGLAEVSPGQNGYRRALLADSRSLGNGDLLGAVEYMHNDGPFEHPDDYQKKNGILRYRNGDAAHGFALAVQAYDGTWNASDQIPLRTIESGQISRFGLIDPTDGGRASRYSLNGELRRGDEHSLTTLSAYVARQNLQLFSNFTYFLDDPVHGDQFEQIDRRTVYGFAAERQWSLSLFGHDLESVLGVQARGDHIHNGLFHTQARQALSTTREDTIDQLSVGPYIQAKVRWTSWLRTIAGLRADAYRFKVDSDLPVNSGVKNSSILSPKLSFLLGPWQQTELYLNFGGGFHSNDARGATLHVDPTTHEAAQPVSPLVRAKGFDFGARTSLIPQLQTAATYFVLDLASELIFSGDAGTTEAGRPSRRQGIEVQTFYQPLSWLAIDVDYARARAQFTDFDPAGAHIPGAIESALSFGATVTNLHGYSGSLRWRYFGPRPLIEDNSVRSRATSLVNLELGYAFAHGPSLGLEVFNVLDSKASDIDYFYISRLPGEPAQGVADIHTHPTESRTARLVLRYNF